MTDMSGRVVIVTGGARGIGRAAMLAFADTGAAVAVADVDGAGGREVEHLLAERGVVALVEQVDVAEREAVDRFVGLVAARLGRVDVLINSAGISHDRAGVDMLDPATWARILSVNLNGTYFATRAVAPHMRKLGRGAIVNVGSVLGAATFAGKIAYRTSKAAELGLTKAAALDLAGIGIRVNCVISGSVDTDMMWRGLDAEEHRQAEIRSAADCRWCASAPRLSSRAPCCSWLPTRRAT